MHNKTDHYFLTIVKEGNLQRASETLYVSQPSLTKYIQRLEKQLGTRLFDRSVSPMQLNEAGRLYYQFLTAQEQRQQQLLYQLDELAGAERGTIKLGIPTYCGQCYLPQVLGRFAQRYPNVQIELFEEHGQTIEKALSDGQIDLGILHLPVESEALYYEELFFETVLLAVPLAAAKKETADISICDFKDIPFIMPHQEQKLGKLVATTFSSVDFAPQIALRTQNVLTMLTLAAQGMGAGFMPAGGIRTLSSEIFSKICFYQPVELRNSGWKLAAVRRKGYYTPAYTRYFIELFAECGKSQISSAPSSLQK